MLDVQLLEAGAKAPVVGHPGEDLGYDVFALEDTTLPYGEVTLVRTGIAVAAYESQLRNVYTAASNGEFTKLRASYVEKGRPLGLLIRDRSSMASKGVVTSGGVIDAGYRGEIKVLLTFNGVTWDDLQKFIMFGRPLGNEHRPVYKIKAGDKIAQMVPIPVLTGAVNLVDNFTATSRAKDGFGSTGV